MKILHITTHIGQGGDWTVIKNSADIFTRNGHEILVASTNASEYKYPALNIPFNQGTKGFISALSKINNVPQDLDIIHAHSPITLFFSLILQLVRCRQAKVLFTYHWLIPSSGLKQKVKEKLFKSADIVHCHALAVYDFLLAEYDLSEAKCQLKYVGVDTERFRLASDLDKSKAREKYNISEENFVLLYAGRLAPEKNIPIILEYLRDTSKDIVFLVAGDGDQKSLLAKLVQQFDISAKVKFLGKISDIESVYTAADLLLLPSSSMETFGMVVIEAALCGLPTLRSDLPGAVDQIDHEKDGFIFPKDESEKMSAIIDDACDGKYDLRKIGEKACQKAKLKFSLETMYAGFLELYTK